VDWNTHEQKVINYIEKSDARIDAYEYKWKSIKRKTEKMFLDEQPDVAFLIICRESN
jgi:hypothetical protein